MAGRVNLYEEEFDTLIRDRGHRALWERAAVCSCVSRDSGQPDFTCPICGGSGYRYLPPKEIIIAVVSFASKYEINSLELREPGTAYATPKSDVIMGYKDRLRFPDFRCTFSEILHWNEAEDGRGISPKTYRNIKDVIFLADDEYEYESGIDFEISKDGHHLEWLNEEFIDKLDGKNMSFLYYTTPSYLVNDVLHEIRGTLSDRKSGGQTTFRELPKQYQLQREDFIYNVATPEPKQKPEQPKEPDISYDDDGGITVG